MSTIKKVKVSVRYYDDSQETVRGLDPSQAVAYIQSLDFVDESKKISVLSQASSLASQATSESAITESGPEETSLNFTKLHIALAEREVEDATRQRNLELDKLKDREYKFSKEVASIEAKLSTETNPDAISDLRRQLDFNSKVLALTQQSIDDLNAQKADDKKGIDRSYIPSVPFVIPGIETTTEPATKKDKTEDEKHGSDKPTTSKELNNGNPEQGLSDEEIEEFNEGSRVALEASERARAAEDARREYNLKLDYLRDRERRFSENLAALLSSGADPATMRHTTFALDDVRKKLSQLESSNPESQSSSNYTQSNMPTIDPPQYDDLDYGGGGDVGDPYSTTPSADLSQMKQQTLTANMPAEVLSAIHTLEGSYATTAERERAFYVVQEYKITHGMTPDVPVIPLHGDTSNMPSSVVQAMMAVYDRSLSSAERASALKIYQQWYDEQQKYKENKQPDLSATIKRDMAEADKRALIEKLTAEVEALVEEIKQLQTNEIDLAENIVYTKKLLDNETEEEFINDYRRTMQNDIDRLEWTREAIKTAKSKLSEARSKLLKAKRM